MIPSLMSLENHIIKNKTFHDDYEKLRTVSLNPNRHLAKNAFEHCELVRERVMDLALENDCSPEETNLLANLARVHDIGKISGSANPSKSVEMLPRYGIVDENFINLVKYHDINLPWFIAIEKGQAPTDKAWRKMGVKVDMKLLCIFMVADRVDCPGSWKANEPLVWFLQLARSKGCLKDSLIIDGEYQ